ncbi:hypothetical protein [Streptomyces sp. NPDC058279]|uniref:hypothetical protein n=1 Tax=Streptomyces sp. NPDC058279 TaxID=3346418 RepID=UPI0036F004D4
MTVSEQGNVAFDYARLTPTERRTYHNDPDGQTTIREAVNKWQQHINDCVKAVSDADHGVKIALEAVVVDSNKDAFGKGNDETYNGFNAGAQGDIEVYEARNAEDIATRINSGDKVSAADYAELDRSFRDNAKSTEFNQTFLNGMGAENTLKLTNRLNDLGWGAPGVRWWSSAVIGACRRRRVCWCRGWRGAAEAGSRSARSPRRDCLRRCRCCPRYRFYWCFRCCRPSHGSSLGCCGCPTAWRPPAGCGAPVLFASGGRARLLRPRAGGPAAGRGIGRGRPRRGPGVPRTVLRTRAGRRSTRDGRRSDRGEYSRGPPWSVVGVCCP